LALLNNNARCMGKCVKNNKGENEGQIEILSNKQGGK
jgi:hypothetical protein